MLQEGDVIKLKKGMRVYADVPEHFVFSNKRGSFKITHTDITLSSEFNYLCGRYIVYKTVTDGGGIGHGPFDVFPDGHHVFCIKDNNRNVKIDFYQSGCFTAMIKNIKPIGKAKLQWVLIDK